MISLVIPFPVIQNVTGSKLVSRYGVGHRRTIFRLIPLILAFVNPLPVAAVIHYSQSSSDPIITSAPTGSYSNSGWQWQGDWGSGNGTVVSPTQILTVAHYSAATFSYNGNTYNQVSAVTNGDMKLVTLDTSTYGDFTSWAPIYSGSAEVGKEFIVFGQGKDRGAAVTLSSESKGWRYGTAGTRRWGTNIFDATLNAGSLLAADFDATGGTTYEAHLATWDSGGGAFMDVGGQWTLVGVNYSVDAYFNTTPSDTGRFMAALYDMGGYDLGSDKDGWTFITNTATDIPSRMYMHRVADYHTWLDTHIVIPEPSTYSLLIALIVCTLYLSRRRIR